MRSSYGACLAQALLACVLAPALALEEPAEPFCPPGATVSLLQHSSQGPSPPEANVAALFGQHATSSTGGDDLVMMHVPYNFGNTVTEVALIGSSGTVRWSHADVELRTQSEVGCPMFLTPQKYWPQDVGKRYFGNRTIFGILRDPYERLVAQFRGQIPGYGFVPGNYSSTCDLNGAIKELLTSFLNDSTRLFDSACTFLPQVEYFQGDFGIQLPIDNRYFPSSMNKVFAEHNYSIRIAQSQILHVSGCNDVWAGDFSPEVRHLIQTVYKDDFDLICETFGYCDLQENVCLVEVPEMCPPKAFEWNRNASRYVPKAGGR